jgi:hypothetical protein
MSRDIGNTLNLQFGLLLEETITDSDEIDATISTLRQIKTRLVAQTRGGGP